MRKIARGSYKPTELSVCRGVTARLVQTLNLCLPEVKLRVPLVTH